MQKCDLSPSPPHHHHHYTLCKTCKNKLCKGHTEHYYVTSRNTKLAGVTNTPPSTDSSLPPRKNDQPFLIDPNHLKIDRQTLLSWSTWSSFWQNSDFAFCEN